MLGPMNPKIDAFLARASKWQAEMEQLRAIILQAPLAEELKWGKPCYTFEGSNVLIIQPFKEYCALMFCKGALLEDAGGILVAPGENSQAARQIRFTSVQQIAEQEARIQQYIQEAIAAEQAGLKVAYKETSDFEVPAELQAAFAENAALDAAFKALTPGRQRGYLLYVSGAKQSKTRTARIEKCAPQILEGKGMHD
jgi:uncharacterized protein YdeI (YjbR/CyaY-like superfamily)